MKSLKSCVNGCDAPVQPPSKVLCKKCLKELSRKLNDIVDNFGVRVKMRAEKAG